MNQSNNILRIHQTLSCIHTLGPFERFVLWTQGCYRNCPGCISPDSRPLSGGTERTVPDLVQEILRHSEQQEGITISGGEPFLQAPALCVLIDKVRAQRDFGVILYTGYTINELLAENAPQGAQDLLQRIDLMIDGPYIQELNDDGSLRGSSNQNVLAFTDRYKSFLPLYGVVGKRTTEVRWTPEGFFIAGIPSKKIANIQRMGKNKNEDP